VAGGCGGGAAGPAGERADANQIHSRLVFQGPTAPFLVALEKGYYKAEGLDVTMDPGQGSAGAVQRVATGAYQIGFADVNATIEYNAKNPGKEVLCVFMAYDFAPFVSTH